MGNQQFTKMTTPKKLDFSSPARVGLSVDEEEDHSDVTPLTLKTSQRKRPASSNEQEEPKKKKKSSSSDLTWNEDDELVILKGLVDFRAKEENDTKFDWDEFYSFIKDLIQVKVSKQKVFTKIVELKNKFLDTTRERINNGIDPHFMNVTEPEAFKLSTLLWGTNDDDNKSVEDQEGNANAQRVNDNEATKTNTDDEPRLELPVHNENKSGGEEKLHDHEAGTSKCDGKVPQQTVVGKSTEDKALGEKTMSHENEARNVNAANGESVQQTVVGEESRDDELSTLQEALDTSTPQILPEYVKKLMRNKLMNLDTQTRKELSDEWKDICSEQTRLSVKMFRFFAKLVEAAKDG